MASYVALTEAQKHLGEFLDRMHPGEELVIEREGKPVAKLTLMPPEAPVTEKRVFGQNVLGITHIAPEFYDDLPLDMFDALRESATQST